MPWEMDWGIPDMDKLAIAAAAIADADWDNEANDGGNNGSLLDPKLISGSSSDRALILKGRK